MTALWGPHPDSDPAGLHAGFSVSVSRPSPVFCSAGPATVRCPQRLRLRRGLVHQHDRRDQRGEQDFGQHGPSARKRARKPRSAAPLQQLAKDRELRQQKQHAMPKAAQQSERSCSSGKTGKSVGIGDRTQGLALSPAPGSDRLGTRPCGPSPSRP